MKRWQKNLLILILKDGVGGLVFLSERWALRQRENSARQSGWRPLLVGFSQREFERLLKWTWRIDGEAEVEKILFIFYFFIYWNSVFSPLPLLLPSGSVCGTVQSWHHVGGICKTPHHLKLRRNSSVLYFGESVEFLSNSFFYFFCQLLQAWVISVGDGDLHVIPRAPPLVNLPLSPENRI